jgi:hypothetical protein
MTSAHWSVPACTVRCMRSEFDVGCPQSSGRPGPEGP